MCTVQKLVPSQIYSVVSTVTQSFVFKSVVDLEKLSLRKTNERNRKGHRSRKSVLGRKFTYKMGDRKGKTLYLLLSRILRVIPKSQEKKDPKLEQILRQTRSYTTCIERS